MLPGPWVHSVAWRDILQSHPECRLRSERSPGPVRSICGENQGQTYMPLGTLDMFITGMEAEGGNVWFFAGVIFCSFRWKVLLCCSVIASGGKSFPTLQQKYAWQGEKCFGSSTLHRVDFQPKSSPSGSSYKWWYFLASLKLLWLWGLRKPLALYRSYTSDIITCRFFFCLDTVKVGPWSSQTQSGAGKRPCYHRKAKGLV